MYQTSRYSVGDHPNEITSDLILHDPLGDEWPNDKRPTKEKIIRDTGMIPADPPMLKSVLCPK